MLPGSSVCVSTTRTYDRVQLVFSGPHEIITEKLPKELKELTVLLSIFLQIF